MMSILTRNVVMVYSLAVLCAALVGCSSDDDKSADLQRQLDMRADISPEDLAEIEGELEEFRMAQMLQEQEAMMRQQQEQARLDTMAAAGLEGGLARSPQAWPYMRRASKTQWQIFSRAARRFSHPRQSHCVGTRLAQMKPWPSQTWALPT